MCTGIVTEPTRELVEFAKEFRTYDFEKCCKMAEQIFTGLEREIRFKGHHINWRTLYSQEA